MDKLEKNSSFSTTTKEMHKRHESEKKKILITQHEPYRNWIVYLLPINR